MREMREARGPGTFFNGGGSSQNDASDRSGEALSLLEWLLAAEHFVENQTERETDQSVRHRAFVTGLQGTIWAKSALLAVMVSTRSWPSLACRRDWRSHAAAGYAEIENFYPLIAPGR